MVSFKSEMSYFLLINRLKDKDEMSIYYTMTEQTDNVNPDGSKKRGFYPRIIRKRTVKLRELCKNAADGTTFNEFELEASVGLIVRQILKELADGNNVSIDGFGAFSISAEAVRTAQTKNDIRAESIRVKRIVFKTSKSLMSKLGGFVFRKKSKN
ncbi:MAG: HU family DNA-binding protein [Prevotellaceae bacterium]|jgi:predicted histone-like DNA-binding protein|nr:HU family DNA-binding protein [Prevotellaceae bacterium]